MDEAPVGFAGLGVSQTLLSTLAKLGYERAATIALTADREGRRLRDAAVASGWVTAEQFDAWVRPRDMARPAASPKPA